MRFNAPPGWSVPAGEWLPDPDWEPDPSWPPAPPAWEFFVEEAESVDDTRASAAVGAGTAVGPVAPQESSTQPVDLGYPSLLLNPDSPAGNQAGRGPKLAIVVGVASAVVVVLGFILVRFGVFDSNNGIGDEGASRTTTGSNWTAVQGPAESAGSETALAPHKPGHPTAITFEVMRDFVYRHYADLPADPRATWDRLDSKFTARTNWSEYAGFWSTIQAVSVTSVQPSGPDSVIARLTLMPYHGNTSTESRRISFVSTGEVLRISGSERLG